MVKRDNEAVNVIINSIIFTTTRLIDLIDILIATYL